ncbi:MAG TPA: hypothetical protein VGX25_23870 [Actinophytocola sp.]|uniref:hypothetical protein n=1 Tax=Actinophytocola sp. TaxID=1872138 RepID=UPI002DDCC894|nr:hypothetical protein [Actinophytocola sp.]HEV2782442.1 hypothetical protein [Actinophytocola sp.]
MYIDSGGGGSAGFGAIGESMKAFAGAAAAGAFAINESGGQALLNAIRDMKDWVDERQQDLQVLTYEPPLGSSHGANTMKSFVPQVATDGQGFITMLMKFRESLTDAEQGINDAMRNYRALDERGSTKLRST